MLKIQKPEKKTEKERISGLVGYSSDESDDDTSKAARNSFNNSNSNSPKKEARKSDDKDGLMKSFHERNDRIAENRKRKYNLGNGGSFWGLGKVTCRLLNFKLIKDQG